MANQQNKDLEKLYNCLLNSSEVDSQYLTNELSLNNIEALVSGLRQMGLDIHQNKQVIYLNHNCEKPDQELIANELRLTQINKPIHYVFTTSSTNKIARENKQPAIYIADHQSAGHGRASKQWLTPLGQSIALTLSHNFDCGLQHLSGLNIAIAVAVIQTINKCGYNHLGLKWPNDLLGIDGKVAGILIEISGNTSSCQAHIGIGINWQIRQCLLDSIEQDCMNIGISNYSKSEFIVMLIIEIENILQEFSTNKLSNIIKIWRQHDALAGKKINIIRDNKNTLADYIGINEQGLLRVKMNKEIKTLASGEVSIRKVD
jgi:BirA family biotin operon repressor/biotin-[acetyl-CoA-carboxylase] ligase